MSKFVIEMGGDSPSYGKVHREGCRDCKDPEYVGDTFEEVMENWPWPEEGPDSVWVLSMFMPCAERVRAMSKATYKITDRATSEVLHNVPSDELLATLQAMFQSEWWDILEDLVTDLRNGVWYGDLEAYLNVSVDLEDSE